MVEEVDGDPLFEGAEANRATARRAPAGAAKTLRAYDPRQSLLLPPSPDDWTPDGHTIRFVSEVVGGVLDLSAMYASYTNRTGRRRSIRG